MMSIEELRQALNILMVHRGTVRTEIGRLEMLLRDTHWIEQAWAQVGSMHIVIEHLDTEAVKVLEKFGGDKQT